MIIWLAIIIPIITIGILYFSFKASLTWWGPIVLLSSTVLFILISKIAVEYIQTQDTEYWGGWVVSAEYYEDWDELVYYTVTVCTGSGKSETCHTETKTRVDYHPPYWEVIDSNNFTLNISNSDFDRLSKQFGNITFIDLHRSHYSNDGDKYITKWNGEIEKIEPVTTQHSYENRVQASESIFNFREVDPTKYGLFDYPSIVHLNFSSILGFAGPSHDEGNKVLNVINAQLGASKQVRIWVLIFDGQPLEAAYDQRDYWKMGNKNEFVICIGIDNNFVINWGYVFSWTEGESLKVDVRNWITERKGQILNVKELADYIHPLIEREWIRKSFSDFSYLSISPPDWVIFLVFFLTLAINIFGGFWIVKNDFKEE